MRLATLARISGSTLSFVPLASLTKPNTRWPRTASGMPTTAASDRRMGRDQRLLHFDRGNVGAAADDDILFTRYEPDIVSFAAPHQIAGMTPAGLKRLLGCLGILPVAGEHVAATEQELSGLAMGDVHPVVVDQADLRALDNAGDRPALQAKGQRS